MTRPEDPEGKGRQRPAAGKFGPRPCPICAKMSVDRYRPFCSKHCADVDLGRWLKEGYTVPAVEPPDDWSGDFPPESDA